MVVLIKTLQVILALSLLIIIHELGHFTFAKIFGIKVEKFYLFFDVGGKALFRFRKGDTEYGIGWLPLGGYCKIAGMIDESMDLESMKQEPQPWEFRTHPAWQRLLVMFGGVLYNFIFAILAYSCILGIWGQSYIPNEGNSIYASELATDMGFRTGDRILDFDGYVPDSFSELQADLARRDVRSTRVLRDGDTLQIYIDQAMMPDILNCPALFELALPFVVDSVSADGSNASSELRQGDRIVAIDTTEIEFLQDSRAILAEHAGQTVEATISRNGELFRTPLQVDSAGRIGVYMMAPVIRTRDYTFLSAIPAGARMTFDLMGGYLQDLKLLATPSTGAYKSVGSFIAIGQVFPASWDWYQFLFILALISIMLGVMNLIPIPGLDGGHIVFTLYEMITGRKPSDKFLTAAQIVGMVLILMLMMLAFGNDIGRLIR